MTDDVYDKPPTHLDAETLLRIRTRQLKWSGDAWCKSAEAALALLPGASNSSHPAHSLWLRVQLHRAPPMEAILSAVQDTTDR